MIDLHMHSTFSDGTLTPSELVERSYKNKVKVMSITDHDNIDGLKEGRLKASEKNITFIDGIEISANFKDKDVHILGYFLDLNDEFFLNWLDDLQKKRYNRTLEILKKLKRLDIEISIEELEEEAKGNVIGRPHIANLLIEKKFVSTMNEAFDLYLGDGKAAYVPKIGVNIVEVVKVLKKNNALVSLAHPHLIGHSDDTIIGIIDLLKKEGLDGLELEYPYIDLKKKKKFMKIARKRELIITGGSDFHGLNRNDIDINCNDISIDIYEKMLERKK